MPWGFSTGVTSVAQTTGVDNIGLDAVSAGIGKLKECSWGGEMTSSTAMATRVARSNGEAGAQTNGSVQNLEGEGNPANVIDSVTSYATTDPTLAAGNLYAESWNAHGGAIRWLADPEEEIWLISGQTLDVISCRGSVGTGTGSWGFRWTEIST